MLSRSLTIFRVFGISVRVHWTWLLLAFMLTASLAKGWFPHAVTGQSQSVYWIMGLLGAVGLFASIVIHELSHALVGRHYKMNIRALILFIFGGVAHLEDEPPSAKAEFWMAIAGPIVSLVLAACFFIGASLISPLSPKSELLLEGHGFFFSSVINVNISPTAPLLINALFSYLATMNVAVALFNMLPAFPLDGGRVLWASLWGIKKDLVWATQIASRCGQMFGVLLVVLGFAGAFVGDFVTAIWFIFLGFLLMTFARDGYVRVLIRQALRGHPAEQFMDTHPTALTPELLVAQLMTEHFSHATEFGSPTVYPVVATEGGSFIGCADIQKVKDIPENEWPQHHVSELVEPCKKEQRITPETDVEAAFQKMSENGVPQLLVLKDDRLVGTLSYQGLLRYLKFRLTT